MIMLRIEYQAQVGQGGALATALIEGNRRITEALDLPGRWRVLTDRTGPWDRVVFEVEMESLAAFEATRPRIFASPEFGEMFARIQGMVASGSTEFYAVEADSLRP